MARSRYDIGLDRVAANFTALTPLDFLARSAAVHPERSALIHGARRQSYAETFARCRRLAGALAERGIGIGDTVSVMASNVPAMFEAHFGVPMAGAVLNALNFRLDAPTIRYMLRHAETRLLIAERTFAPVLREALAGMDPPPYVVTVGGEPAAADAVSFGDEDYEHFLGRGSAEHPWVWPEDEWQAISLSYTSGTTGEPKGVVYHHRGAYLNALGNVLMLGLGPDTTYLWTLPMFHCNGWSHIWAVTAVAGTHVCLEQVEPAEVFRLIAAEGVSHMAGAPIVLNLLINAPEADKRRFEQTVEVATGGAAPPHTVIAAMEQMGFRVTHLYGLTECYGPALVAEAQSHWAALPGGERAAEMARQGVRHQAVRGAVVADPETLRPLPADGQSMGEILLRGNTMMKGYLKEPAATKKAFRGGWFHTGDLGVTHPDGYIEVKDRSKDVIISGGENISSIEVENLLYRHDAVLEAAVVAKPDERWGESPCAFVTLKDSAQGIGEADIVGFCRQHLAHFKVPSTVIFGPLPKTATGKIQKFALRDRAKNL